MSHREDRHDALEGEVVSGWEAVESFEIASQAGREPLKGSPQGSGVIPQVGPGPCHCPGHLTTWGLWALNCLALRQYQSREGWVLIHGVWATDSQFPGPRG